MAAAATKHSITVPLLTGPRDSETVRTLASGAVLLAPVIAAVSALLMVPVYFITSLHSTATILICTLPVAAALDILRATAFKLRKGSTAAMIDGTWLLTQVAISLSLTTQIQTAWSMTLAWSLGAIFAVVGGMILLKLYPAPAALRTAWGTVRPVGASLATDRLLVDARVQAAPLLLAAVAGMAATGALRAGLTLVGPINAVIAGLTPLITMWVAERLHAPAQARRVIIAWGLAIVALGAACGLFVIGIPIEWGRAAMGAAWNPARELIVPLGIYIALQGFVAAGGIVLRAAHQTIRLVRYRLSVETVSLTAPIIGVLLGSTKGAAYGFAVAAAVSAAISARVAYEYLSTAQEGAVKD